MRRYFVYYDAIEETGEIIYVGEGNFARTYKNKKRSGYNEFYTKINNKHQLTRTIFEVDSKEIALEFEAYLIDIFHTWVDDPFCTKYACNIVQNSIEGFKQHSQLSGDKIRNSKKGKKRPPLTPEWKANLSIAGKGRKMSDHTRQLLIESCKKRPPKTQEHRDNLSKSHKNKKLSVEHKLKLKIKALAHYAKKRAQKLLDETNQGVNNEVTP
jgi:hypothetical protein